MTAPDVPQDGWLIHKAGRGWYRPKAQGYTAHPSEAGRYSHADAMSHSYPNGWSGPRDGITIKHESELEPRHMAHIPTRQLVETLEQALSVIEEVQTYQQPDDPWVENALTMGELDVFDFKVAEARALLEKVKKSV